MVNYNMGRYYAWENLSKFIKTSIRKRFFPPNYRFNYVPPKTHTSPQFIPFEQWKASNPLPSQTRSTTRASSSTQ
jgi:hypothetical protein